VIASSDTPVRPEQGRGAASEALIGLAFGLLFGARTTKRPSAVPGSSWTAAVRRTGAGLFGRRPTGRAMPWLKRP
jgi:hypothetical protein